MDMKFVIKAGGGSPKLAKALGLKFHGSVLKWKRVPDRHLVKIEQITGIPREALRPDLYIRQPQLTPDEDEAERKIISIPLNASRKSG